MASGEKQPDAFRTIGELARELGVAQHILRYWETKFPQLKPLQRAGNRRYYRPADVDLARKIHRLLSQDGYTVRGVQKLLHDRNSEESSEMPMTAVPPPAPPVQADEPTPAASGVDMFRLVALRNRLASALDG